MKLNKITSIFHNHKEEFKKISTIPFLLSSLLISPSHGEWINQNEWTCKLEKKNSILYKKLKIHTICSNTTHIPYTVKGKKLLFKDNKISLLNIDPRDINWVNKYLKENNYVQAWRTLKYKFCYCDYNWDLKIKENNLIKKSKEIWKKVKEEVKKVLEN